MIPIVLGILFCIAVFIGVKLFFSEDHSSIVDEAFRDAPKTTVDSQKVNYVQRPKRSAHPTSIDQIDNLYDLLKYVEEHGELKAVSRLRVRVLPHTLKEKIYLANVKPETQCSPELLRVVISEAKIVLHSS